MVMDGADVCDVVAEIPYVFEMHVSIWAPGWNWSLGADDDSGDNE
jgi:hypothetical protein